MAPKALIQNLRALAQYLDSEPHKWHGQSKEQRKRDFVQASFAFLEILEQHPKYDKTSRLGKPIATWVNWLKHNKDAKQSPEMVNLEHFGLRPFKDAIPLVIPLLSKGNNDSVSNNAASGTIQPAQSNEIPSLAPPKKSSVSKTAKRATPTTDSMDVDRDDVGKTVDKPRRARSINQANVSDHRKEVLVGNEDDWNSKLDSDASYRAPSDEESSAESEVPKRPRNLNSKEDAKSTKINLAKEPTTAPANKRRTDDVGQGENPAKKLKTSKTGDTVTEASPPCEQCHVSKSACLIPKPNVACRACKGKRLSCSFSRKSKKRESLAQDANGAATDSEKGTPAPSREVEDQAIPKDSNLRTAKNRFKDTRRASAPTSRDEHSNVAPGDGTPSTGGGTFQFTPAPSASAPVQPKPLATTTKNTKSLIAKADGGLLSVKPASPTEIPWGSIDLAISRLVLQNAHQQHVINELSATVTILLEDAKTHQELFSDTLRFKSLVEDNERQLEGAQNEIKLLRQDVNEALLPIKRELADNSKRINDLNRSVGCLMEWMGHQMKKEFGDPPTLPQVARNDPNRVAEPIESINPARLMIRPGPLAASSTTTSSHSSEESNNASSSGSSSNSISAPVAVPTLNLAEHAEGIMQVMQVISDNMSPPGSSNGSGGRPRDPHTAEVEELLLLNNN